MTYTFFTDPGHGWLEVSLKEIEDLKIGDKISSFSYKCTPYVYLEEDCDLTVFLNAKFENDKEAKSKFMNGLDEHYSSDESRVRRMNPYK